MPFTVQVMHVINVMLILIAVKFPSCHHVKELFDSVFETRLEMQQAVQDFVYGPSYCFIFTMNNMLE